MKKILGKNEFYVFLIVLALCLLVQLRSGQFFTSNNIVDIVRSMVVPGMFAIGVFLVILSGGIDVSFTALAALSGYAATRIFIGLNYEGPVIIPFIVAALFGFILGAFNGFLISKFKISTLIITLGTASAFRGIMQGALNATEFPTIPKPMVAFGEASLFIAKNPTSGLTSKMPATVLILIGMLIIAFFIIKYTIWGRGIYAIGGNENSAISAGFGVKKIQFFIYCFVGMIAGIAGMTRVVMMERLQPTNLLGMELTVIAAVVLGGTRISGGIGTLIGTILGISLFSIMENSLILLGIPSYWQLFFVGLLIIIGTSISAFQSKLGMNKLLANG